MAGDAWIPLVSRIAAGERDAERQLVDHFHRGIRALVRRHSRPSDPAVDDIAQDVLFHVIERLRAGAIQDPSALPAYIRTTIVHATTAEYRRRRLRGEGAIPDGMEEIAASAADPADLMNSLHIGERIRALIEEMPVRRDREVLVRFYLQESDKQDICRDLGIEPAHFHRVIYRARSRLRELASAHGLGKDDAGGTTRPLAAPDHRKPAGRLGTGTHE